MDGGTARSCLGQEQFFRGGPLRPEAVALVFPLSPRMVEEMLSVPGIVVSRDAPAVGAEVR